MKLQKQLFAARLLFLSSILLFFPVAIASIPGFPDNAATTQGTISFIAMYVLVGILEARLLYVQARIRNVSVKKAVTTSIVTVLLLQIVQIPGLVFALVLWPLVSLAVSVLLIVTIIKRPKQSS